MYGKFLTYQVMFVLLPFPVFSQRNWTLQSGDVAIKIMNAAGNFDLGWTCLMGTSLASYLEQGA